MDEARRADIQSARRVYGDQHIRIGFQLAGENDLLLVAAGEIPDLLVGGLASDVVFADHLPGIGRDGLLFHMQAVQRGKLRLVGLLEHKIVRDRHVADQALQIPVLRDERHVVLDRGPRAEDRDLLSLALELAALRREHARQQLRELRLPVAVHTGNADDLAPADAEADVIEARVLGLLMIIDVLQGDDRSGLHVLLFVLRLLQLAADHHVGQLLPGDAVRVHCRDDLARAQDGDAVGDVQHLTHLVADKDDGFSFADELFHDGEQTLDLDVRQRRGRLVQNQQLRAVVERLQDLHALLRADGDLRNQLVQLHVQPVFFRQREDLLPPRLPVDKDTLGIPVAEDHVFKHGHRLDQHEVLMHHADAELDRLAGRLDPHLPAVEKDRPLRRLVKTDQNVHQRRFARTVFAEQGMDLALGYGQIDIVVRIEVTESFADVLHAQQFFQLNHAPLYSLSGSS